jgi:hypothetical protein
VLPATSEQLAFVAALGQGADDAHAFRFGMPAVLLEHKSKVLSDDSKRETPRSRAAPESGRSSSGFSAIVVAFFLDKCHDSTREDGQGRPRFCGDGETAPRQR